MQQLSKRLGEELALKSQNNYLHPHFSSKFILQKKYFGCSFAYRCCKFSNFNIKVGQSDGFCLISGTIPVSVLGFATCNCIQGVIVKRYIDPQPFFESPINSIAVGVILVRNLSDDIEFFPLNEISHKLMALPFNESFVLIKLLHKYNN